MKELKRKFKKSIKKNWKKMRDSGILFWLFIGLMFFIFFNSMESWGFGWMVVAVFILISIPIIYGIIICILDYISDTSFSHVLSVYIIYITASVMFSWIGFVAVSILHCAIKEYGSFTKRINEIDNKLDKLTK